MGQGLAELLKGNEAMQSAFKFEEDQLMVEVSRWEHSETDKGQIYTRPDVVDFMLDVIGLRDAEDLENVRILEPSCGEGEFVVAIAKRLVCAPMKKPTITQLMGKVLAIDLVVASLEITKSRVRKLLVDNGYLVCDIDRLLCDWFLVGDFLLEDIESNFTHVVGNPPYVRIESVPKGLLREYRRMFSTMTDRADLYIPFFEKSLSLLVEDGKLSFICTDRWTKNTYGRALRQLISSEYSLELFVDLYGVDAFESEVMTYPAITQIVKTAGRQTVLVHEASFTQKEADDVLKSINKKPSSVQTRKDIVRGGNPWLLGSSDQVALIRKLEDRYPSLEEVGCKVYIGAATGANKVYVVEKEKVDIEDSRLLPVITAKELKSGNIQWQGKYLVNTYDDRGVVGLEDYPKLSCYLESYREELCKRHVAKKNIEKWYKTIDRVYENRSKMEKILIPDISSDPVAIYDKGIYHPNNSIYYICSSHWNLQALRVVLLSDITKIFISTYSTKIANGYLRFQSQHLRKIRIPAWGAIDVDLRLRMTEAGTANEVRLFTALTSEMYGLNANEISIVGDCHAT